MRNIFFDLDGTLVDSLPGIEYSVDSALRELRLERGVPLRPLIGPPIRTILKMVAVGATADQLDRLEAAFRAVYDSIGWRKTMLHAGAAQALAQLRQAGFRLFLVTNKPLDATNKILSWLGLKPHFEDVVARDSAVPVFRSKAQMLCRLLAEYSLDARECLMVGDTMEDYRAAVESGVKAAIMTHGYGTREEPNQAECRLLNDFSELTSLCMEGR
jgi:phosphoglycolate phosphatase